ncbi:hypothetical protein AiwAL_15965 [Acidiphilium sp. AL]|uniref:Uncharacterized protein n=1 Tax=Acidiphilium iwatense TaxID=768198 RepID=A0ABS9DYG3_9PROT|nr:MULTISPECIES: hypothetical protein [Acidiphilium]MCF3947792.1 hypothetical protein [Acidiphilium iwatense]MCU4161578.1 hypothetical protein [Acidiphilium sp. AL]
MSAPYTRDQMDRLAAAMATLAPHRLPLIRAARDGLITLIQPRRNTTIPSRLLNDQARPAVILIGDDDYTSTGPAGWTCARRVRFWGRAAMIHAAAAEPEHYETIVIAAALHQRSVLIETDSTHQPAWITFLQPAMGCLIIACPPGQSHPAHPHQSGLQ